MQEVNFYTKQKLTVVNRATLDNKSALITKPHNHLLCPQVRLLRVESCPLDGKISSDRYGAVFAPHVLSSLSS